MTSMVRVLAMAALCSLSACSFLVAAGDGGTDAIKHKHEYLDTAGMAVAGAACVVGLALWQNPDSFAPVQDDPTSWRGGDRDAEIAKGQTVSAVACTGGLIYLASALYGRHYALQNEGDDTSNWLPAAAAMGAFATGFANARQQATYLPPVSAVRPDTTPAGRTCYSDFGCGVGYSCVKPKLKSEGTCFKSVDEDGAPTFDGPSPDSVGPKQPDPHDCDFDADCPTGFHCEPKSGACLR